jgi:hypothetical protein
MEHIRGMVKSKNEAFYDFVKSNEEEEMVKILRSIQPDKGRLYTVLQTKAVIIREFVLRKLHQIATTKICKTNLVTFSSSGYETYGCDSRASPSARTQIVPHYQIHQCRRGDGVRQTNWGRIHS